MEFAARKNLSSLIELQNSHYIIPLLVGTFERVK